MELTIKRIITYLVNKNRKLGYIEDKWNDK
jgi:hypothetical protein